MRKKRLIRKLGIVGLIIFAISITIVLLQYPYRDSQDEIRRKRLDEHVGELTKKYNDYLIQIEKRINSIPVNQNTISELESELLFESQQINKLKKYLWMANTRGDLIFGIPSDMFTALNSVYDKRKDDIENDGIYKNRNDFLLNW